MITLHAYKDQVVGVFGLGKAGLATVKALVRGGAKVVAWDDNEAGRKALAALALDVQLRPIKKWPWDHLSLITLSPGIPLTHPKPHAVVTEAKQHCLPIIGDIELLYQAQPHATYIAITGTNGKSTTTALIGHVLKHAGKRVEVGGNIGTAALSLAPLGEGEIYVLELSSYQLDLLATTRFDLSLMLNISADHLDRHGSMEGYIAAKMHIFDRQTEHDHAIIAVDDAHMRGIKTELSSRLVELTTVTTTNESADLSVKDGVIQETPPTLSKQLGKGPQPHPKPLESSAPASGVDHIQEAIDGLDKHGIDLTPIRTLQGRHNWQNAVSACAVARRLNISQATIAEAFACFPGLAHRMEWVAEKQGITFINDSKATNAEAASHALSAFHSIYWILGGAPKEGGIESLRDYFPSIKRAYLIGQAQDEFANTLGGEVLHTECDTLDKALQKAVEDVRQAGDEHAVIMFSPACASFDQYPNFEARGDHFKALVGDI